MLLNVGSRPKQAVWHQLETPMNLLVGTPLPRFRDGRIKLSLPKGPNKVTTESDRAMD